MIIPPRYLPEQNGLKLLNCYVKDIDSKTYTMKLECSGLQHAITAPIPMLNSANGVGFTAVPTVGQALKVLFDGINVVPLPLFPIETPSDGYKGIRPSNPSPKDLYMIGWHAGYIVKDYKLISFVTNDDGENSIIEFGIDKNTNLPYIINKTRDWTLKGKYYSFNIKDVPESSDATFEFKTNSLNITYESNQGLNLQLTEPAVRITVDNNKLLLSKNQAYISIEDDQIILKVGNSRIIIDSGGKMEINVDKIVINTNEAKIQSNNIEHKTSDFSISSSNYKVNSNIITQQGSNISLDGSKIDLDSRMTTINGDITASNNLNVLGNENVLGNLTVANIQVVLITDLEQLKGNVNNSLQTLTSSLIAHTHVTAVGPSTPPSSPIVCPIIL